MKKKILALLLAMVFILGACSGKEDVKAPEDGKKIEGTDKGEVKKLRLTTTTSVNDSGLMEYLRPALKEDTNIEMEIVSKGSGAAIEDGRMGNADVILVHSPKAEKEFVEEGYGIERKSFMHNYFVIVGPEADPAKIEGKSAEEAFSLIASSDAVFVSRGDESGTHKKELSIWEAVGQDIEELKNKENYNSLGDGMGATLTFASEKNGYTLTDLATFLSMQKELDLKVLVDQSESLKNTYSIILVNPDKVEGVNKDLAKEFQDWMTGEKAAEMIDKYGLDEYGQQLFIKGE
ncbi:MAG: substrate-binding domain-containing protein [Tissierellia bacterium]|nr:substrate-binding domain-containing protein [Tissierellia bacterium]